MKNHKIVIIGLMLITIIVSTTYAWFRWTSSNNNVSFTVNGMTITYDGGANISGITLLPVTNRANGVTAGTAIAKTITAQSSRNNVYMNLYLDVNSIDSGLKENTFKWELVEGNTTLGSGNFASSNAGDTINLVTDEELSTTTSTYTLYIWIDGTVDNPVSMQNQSFSFTLHADATDQVPVLANEKIIELAGNCTSWESGFEGVCATNAYDDNGVTKYHEYRYVGGEVDNWVRFNNDDYRIIGVFDDNSHGVTGQNLIKLIAARELIAASWGVYNALPSYITYSGSKNDWTGTTTGVKANANVILNEYFLNASNTSTIYGDCINWTYGYNSNTYKSKNCSNIVGYGIQNNVLRNYIQPVTWYLYGYTDNNLSKQNWYQCERNNHSDCTSANLGAYSGTTTAPIGLMYLSDYMYGSGYVASSDTTTGSSWIFMNSNWLYNGYEWTVTPKSKDDNSAFNISSLSYIDSFVESGFGLRPAFYLKSTIKIKSGNGSFNDPYIIG